MKVIIYYMIGCGWIMGYDLAQSQHPTKIAKTSQGDFVLTVLAWPVVVSSEISRIVYSNSVESSVQNKNGI
jgi:hypothetical protein